MRTKARTGSGAGGGRRPAAPALGLHSLAPAAGSKRNRKRVGRGRGSGQGRTAGRGEKGQLSRSGYSRRRGFEGGQMPLQRRLPKRGFSGPGREPYSVVNLKQLADLPAGSEVTPDRLIELGLVRKRHGGVKVLGDGELKVALHVKVHRFSRSAAEKIEKAGGRAEVLPA